MNGSAYHYADYLRDLKGVNLLRQLRFDLSVAGLSLTSYRVLRCGFWPLLPERARRSIRCTLMRSSIPSWINLQFARRIQLSERLRKQPTRREFSNYAQRGRYHFLTSGDESLLLETLERTASCFGLELRHPFYDQRIIEFTLALPDTQCWRRDQQKFILRQAMHKLLPEIVRQRRTKADFSYVFPETLQAQRGEHCFDYLAIASLEWIDSERVRKMYRQMIQAYARGDKNYYINIYPLWMIFGIELWFKTVFSKAKSFTRKASYS